MPVSNEKDKEVFLQEVISYIKLPFDRSDIYEELNDHIIDRIHDFMEEGMSHDEAIDAAVEAMGDARDVGQELNQMHKPLLGWIWKISNIMVKSLGVIVVCWMVILAVMTINLYNPFRDIDKEDVVYHLSVNEKAKIDDLIIEITDILYESNETLHIKYRTYNSKFYVSSWNFSNLGVITDEFGKEYFGGGSTSNGLISYCHSELDNFPIESKELNIMSI